MAITQMEHSVVIKRPIKDVFEYVSKAENMPTWAEKVMQAEQTSEGTVDVGTTCFVVTKGMGMELKQDFVVTECEKNHVYSAKSTSGPVSMETRYEFETVEGGTRLHLNVTAELGGLIKFAGPLLTRRLKKQLQDDHANLKRLLESQG